MEVIRFLILLFSILSLFSIFLYFYISLRKKKKLMDSFFDSTNNQNTLSLNEASDSKLMQMVVSAIKNSKKNIKLEHFFIASLVCGIIGGILGYIATEFAVMGIFAAIGASLIPYFKLSSIARARKKEIAQQFPQMLKHISNYLKAGNNLRQAIEKTVLVTDGALGEVLGDIVQRINSGRTISHAINAAYDEVPLMEFKMFDILMRIHNDMGGDLTSSLENLTIVIDEKKALRSEIDTLTQETRISAYLTAIIPTLLYLTLRYASPDYMKQLEQLPWGKLGIVVSFAFIISGVFVVKKISAVKVDESYK